MFPYFWSLCDDGQGGLFVGAGDNGQVYRLKDGRLTPFAQTGELMVHALVRAADGNLYAATSPHGRVYKITAAGKSTIALQTDSTYALALAVSKDGRTLYAGTGGKRAFIYSLPLTLTQSDPAVVYQSDELHITALSVAPDGTLYAGTAPSGLVMRIPNDSGDSKTPTVIYDSGESGIAGIAFDREAVYVTTAPRGNLYKLAPNSHASTTA